MNRYWACHYLALFVIIASALEKPTEDQPAKHQPIAISSSIKDKYPCIYTLLKDSIINGNYPYQIDVYKLLSTMDKNLLVFAEKELPEKIAAYTGMAYLNIKSGVLLDTIFLNPVFLKNASKEYLVSVIIHEGIHAFINWCILSYNHKKNGVNKEFLRHYFPTHWRWLTRKPESLSVRSQHILLSENYIDKMARCINAYTSNRSPVYLRDSIAFSLAWGGLAETPKWKYSDMDTCYMLTVDGWARNMNAPAEDKFIHGECDKKPKTFLNRLNLHFPCN